MRRVFAGVVATVVVAIGVAGALTGSVAAHPSPTQAMARSDAGTPMISKIHGFHCRSVLGWDPVAGVYRYHRHPGICHDYKRCLRVQKRCVFMLGRGFQRWSYEAFGYDNERYTRCMVRGGCY